MKALQILIFSLFLITKTSHSQTKTYLSDAVNIAGKQRMLGQRMAKTKVFLKANKKKNLASKELKQTIIAFEQGLEILKKFAPTEAIKKKISIQENAFKPYKKKILSRSDKSLKEIIDSNTSFLKICDDVVTELITYSKSIPKSPENTHQNYIIDKIAKATGASGKLRYLTQRLTLYFAMNEFGFKVVSPSELSAIIKDLDSNLAYLTVLEFNTIDIDDSLSLVDYYWDQLKFNLHTKNGKFNTKQDLIDATLLYDLCNNILDKANQTTKMYADLNKEH